MLRQLEVIRDEVQDRVLQIQAQMESTQAKSERTGTQGGSEGSGTQAEVMLREAWRCLQLLNTSRHLAASYNARLNPIVSVLLNIVALQGEFQRLAEQLRHLVRQMPGDGEGATEDPQGVQRDPGQTQGDPGQKQGDPGQMQGDPGQMQRDPGQMQGDPGQMQGDPGQMQGDPGQMQRDPGQMQGDPGQMQRDPGQMQEDPGQMQEDPGRCIQSRIQALEETIQDLREQIKAVAEDLKLHRAQTRGHAEGIQISVDQIQNHVDQVQDGADQVRGPPDPTQEDQGQTQDDADLNQGEADLNHDDTYVIHDDPGEKQDDTGEIQFGSDCGISCSMCFPRRPEQVVPEGTQSDPHQMEAGMQGAAAAHSGGDVPPMITPITQVLPVLTPNTQVSLITTTTQPTPPPGQAASPTPSQTTTPTPTPPSSQTISPTPSQDASRTPTPSPTLPSPPPTPPPNPPTSPPPLSPWQQAYLDFLQRRGPWDRRTWLRDLGATGTEAHSLVVELLRNAAGPEPPRHVLEERLRASRHARALWQLRLGGGRYVVMPGSNADFETRFRNFRDNMWDRIVVEALEDHVTLFDDPSAGEDPYKSHVLQILPWKLAEVDDENTWEVWDDALTSLPTDDPDDDVTSLQSEESRENSPKAKLLKSRYFRHWIYDADKTPYQVVHADVMDSSMDHPNFDASKHITEWAFGTDPSNLPGYPWTKHEDLLSARKDHVTRGVPPRPEHESWNRKWPLLHDPDPETLRPEAARLAELEQTHETLEKWDEDQDALWRTARMRSREMHWRKVLLDRDESFLWQQQHMRRHCTLQSEMPPPRRWCRDLCCGHCDDVDLSQMTSRVARACRCSGSTESASSGTDTGSESGSESDASGSDDNKSGSESNSGPDGRGPDIETGRYGDSHAVPFATGDDYYAFGYEYLNEGDYPDYSEYTTHAQPNPGHATSLSERLFDDYREYENEQYGEDDPDYALSLNERLFEEELAYRRAIESDTRRVEDATEDRFYEPEVSSCAPEVTETGWVESASAPPIETPTLYDELLLRDATPERPRSSPGGATPDQERHLSPPGDGARPEGKRSRLVFRVDSFGRGLLVDSVEMRGLLKDFEEKMHRQRGEPVRDTEFVNLSPPLSGRPARAIIQAFFEWTEDFRDRTSSFLDWLSRREERRDGAKDDVDGETRPSSSAKPEMGPEGGQEVRPEVVLKRTLLADDTPAEVIDCAFIALAKTIFDKVDKSQKIYFTEDNLRMLSAVSGVGSWTPKNVFSAHASSEADHVDTDTDTEPEATYRKYLYRKSTEEEPLSWQWPRGRHYDAPAHCSLPLAESGDALFATVDEVGSRPRVRVRWEDVDNEAKLERAQSEGTLSLRAQALVTVLEEIQKKCREMASAHDVENATAEELKMRRLTATWKWMAAVRTGLQKHHKGTVMLWAFMHNCLHLVEQTLNTKCGKDANNNVPKEATPPPASSPTAPWSPWRQLTVPESASPATLPSVSLTTPPELHAKPSTTPPASLTTPLVSVVTPSAPLVTSPLPMREMRSNRYHGNNTNNNSNKTSSNSYNSRNNNSRGHQIQGVAEALDAKDSAKPGEPMAKPSRPQTSTTTCLAAPSVPLATSNQPTETSSESIATSSQPIGTSTRPLTTSTESLATSSVPPATPPVPCPKALQDMRAQLLCLRSLLRHAVGRGDYMRVLVKVVEGLIGKEVLRELGPDACAEDVGHAWLLVLLCLEDAIDTTRIVAPTTPEWNRKWAEYARKATPRSAKSPWQRVRQLDGAWLSPGGESFVSSEKPSSGSPRERGQQRTEEETPFEREADQRARALLSEGPLLDGVSETGSGGVAEPEEAWSLNHVTLSRNTAMLQLLEDEGAAAAALLSVTASPAAIRGLHGCAKLWASVTSRAPFSAAPASGPAPAEAETASSVASSVSLGESDMSSAPSPTVIQLPSPTEMLCPEFEINPEVSMYAENRNISERTWDRESTAQPEENLGFTGRTSSGQRRRDDVVTSAASHAAKDAAYCRCSRASAWKRWCNRDATPNASPTDARCNCAPSETRRHCGTEKRAPSHVKVNNGDAVRTDASDDNAIDSGNMKAIDDAIANYAKNNAMHGVNVFPNPKRHGIADIVYDVNDDDLSDASYDDDLSDAKSDDASSDASSDDQKADEELDTNDFYFVDANNNHKLSDAKSDDASSDASTKDDEETDEDLDAIDLYFVKFREDLMNLSDAELLEWCKWFYNTDRSDVDTPSHAKSDDAMSDAHSDDSPSDACRYEANKDLDAKDLYFVKSRKDLMNLSDAQRLEWCKRVYNTEPCETEVPSMDRRVFEIVPTEEPGCFLLRDGSPSPPSRRLERCDVMDTSSHANSDAASSDVSSYEEANKDLEEPGSYPRFSLRDRSPYRLRARSRFLRCDEGEDAEAWLDGCDVALASTPGDVKAFELAFQGPADQPLMADHRRPGKRSPRAGANIGPRSGSSSKTPPEKVGKKGKKTLEDSERRARQQVRLPHRSLPNARQAEAAPPEPEPASHAANTSTSSQEQSSDTSILEESNTNMSMNNSNIVPPCRRAIVRDAVYPTQNLLPVDLGLLPVPSRPTESDAASCTISETNEDDSDAFEMWDDAVIAKVPDGVLKPAHSGGRSFDIRDHATHWVVNTALRRSHRASKGPSSNRSRKCPYRKINSTYKSDNNNAKSKSSNSSNKIRQSGGSSSRNDKSSKKNKNNRVTRNQNCRNSCKSSNNRRKNNSSSNSSDDAYQVIAEGAVALDASLEAENLISEWEHRPEPEAKSAKSAPRVSGPAQQPPHPIHVTTHARGATQQKPKHVDQKPRGAQSTQRPHHVTRPTPRNSPKPSFRSPWEFPGRLLRAVKIRLGKRA